MGRSRSIATLGAMLVLFAGAAVESASSQTAPRTAISAVVDPPVDQHLHAYLGKAVRVVTTGGGQFQGTLVAVTDDRVELVTSEGLIQQIWKADVVQVIDLSAEAGGATYFQDASASRLLLMPTGFPLPAGSFQIADQEILAVTGSYGFSRAFSVWGGVTIFGALLNARLALPVGSHIGISSGAMIATSWFDVAVAVGLPYIIASFGNPDQNFTLGVSVPVATAGGLAVAGGILAIGGKVVISSTASIVTENWIYVPVNYGPEAGFIFPAVAFRIAGSRFSWDIGAVVPLTLGPGPSGEPISVSGMLGGIVIPIPLLSFTYRIR